jgi:MFS family permease
VTTASTTAESSALRRDVRVIGLVGSAHCLSHFFQLALPPLFPLLKAEFDVSYATLGGLVSVFYVASGLCQFGAGFAVDRIGARPVLLGGIALLAGGTLLGGLVPGAYWLFPLVALMGIGNGVFHPADFALLNATVDPRRLGHAYSTHGVGGSLGYALAPIVSRIGLARRLDARGSGGSPRWHFRHAERRASGAGRCCPASQLPRQRCLFMQTPILLCFSYPACAHAATIAFRPRHRSMPRTAPLALATSALAAYLLGSTAGILAGGFLAAATKQHHRVAASGLAVGSALMLMVAAYPALAPWAIPVFALTGFALGATGPSRDMIVRNATPPGASGRVYGFVYSGLDLGATIAPVMVGALLDHGLPRVSFAVVALFLCLAIGTVRRRSETRSGVSATRRLDSRST